MRNANKTREINEKKKRKKEKKIMISITKNIDFNLFVV